jgi:hypothetical protein
MKEPRKRNGLTRDKEKRSGQPAMNRSKQRPVWVQEPLSFYWLL